jgi:menaquinone-dependent protoporphyrinogen oxidase
MSSHGCAEKAARLLESLLPGSPGLVNLETQDAPDLSLYDTILIGGSIRIGSIQKRIRKFCEKNLESLLTKRIGLFICCMYEGEKAMDQLRKNFPEAVVIHATATGVFGGELDFNVMNAFEKMIIRDIIGIEVNVSLFDEAAVRKFALEMQ